MNGYDFITAVDDKKWGTVVDQQGDYLIVEHGTLRKHRYAVPISSVDVDESAEEARTTLSGELVSESPRVDDGFDRDSSGVRLEVHAAIRAAARVARSRRRQMTLGSR